MSHIFISYSRSDLDQAQKIVGALAASKLDTWIDWKSIPKGEDWEQEIYHGIEAAEAFLFLISSDSVVSDMCNREIAHAVRNGKRILPIFIVDVPDREMYNVSAKFLREENRTEISRRNFIKCRLGRDDFETAVGEIRTTIQTDYEWLKYHTRLQVKALEWERRKGESRLLRGDELKETEQKLAAVGSKKDPQPTPSQRQYVLASRTDEDRRRRRTTRVLTVGIAALTVLCAAAVVASIIAVGQRNLAVTREQEALAAQALAEEERRLALSNGLATQSRLLFDDQLDLSMLLAVLSGQINPTAQAAGALHDALEHRPDLVQYISAVSPGGVTRLAYTPDGSQLVGVDSGGSIWRWDVESGEVIDNPVENPGIVTLGLTIGPEGEVWVVSGSEQGVFVWEAPGRDLLGPEILFTDDVDGDERPDLPHLAALSSDGSILAVAVREEITVWDVESGGLLGRSDIFLGFPPRAMEFSPDASLLASAGNEWQIYLWDPFSALNFDIWQTSQTREITSLSFSSNGQFIASGSVDGTVNLFDLASGELLLHLPSYSITTGQEIPPPALGHPAAVLSLALSPTGVTLISGAADGSMLIWDTNTWTPQSAPKTAFVGPIRALAWSPDGTTFAAGGGDEAITIWHPYESWRLLQAKTDDQLDLTFVYEDYQSAELDEPNLVHLAHIESGYTAESGCNESVESYEPCPGGFVNTYAPDGQAIELQAAALNNWPENLTFDRNGTKLAVTTCRTTSGYDCPTTAIWIWSLPDGVIQQYESYVERVSRLVFSPDGRYLALGGEGREIGLIDLYNGREITLPLLRLPGQISGLAFSPDGTRLTASASFEDPGPYANTIYHSRMVVWDVQNGQVIAQGSLPGSTAGEPAFTEDGRLLSYIIQEGNEFPFQIWTLGIEQWQEIACRIVNRNLTQTEWERYVVGEEFREVCP